MIPNLDPSSDAHEHHQQSVESSDASFEAVSKWAEEFQNGESPDELSAEDEAILDHVWDEIGRENLLDDTVKHS